MPNPRDRRSSKDAAAYSEMVSPLLTAGINREREMSVMVSALAHVVAGDDVITSGAGGDGILSLTSSLLDSVAASRVAALAAVVVEDYRHRQLQFAALITTMTTCLYLETPPLDHHQKNPIVYLKVGN